MLLSPHWICRTAVHASVGYSSMSKDDLCNHELPPGCLEPHLCQGACIYAARAGLACLQLARSAPSVRASSDPLVCLPVCPSARSVESVFPHPKTHPHPSTHLPSARTHLRLPRAPMNSHVLYNTASSRQRERQRGERGCWLLCSIEYIVDFCQVPLRSPLRFMRFFSLILYFSQPILEVLVDEPEKRFMQQLGRANTST